MNRITRIAILLHIFQLAPRSSKQSLSAATSYNTQLASQIAFQNYPDCSLILVTQYSLRDVPEENWAHLFVTPPIATPFLTVYLAQLTSVQGLSNVTDLRRFTSYCKLVVSLIPPPPDKFLFSKFMTLLNPLHTPITQRDLDHYIFLSSDSDPVLINDFLSHPEIHRELKFKLMITPSSDMYTLCIYCPVPSFEGRGSLISISLVPGESSLLFPDFTSDMHGYRMRVVGPLKYTSVFEVEKVVNATLSSDDEPKYKFNRGLYIDTFHLVQKKLNFTYAFHPCYAYGHIKEGKTGILLKNGSWAGCVGDVLNNRADFAVATSAVDKDRYQAVEYLTPLCYNYIMFFTHRPLVVYSWRTPFRAFDAITWGLVLGLIVVVAVISYVFDHQVNRLKIASEQEMSLPFGPFIMDLYGYMLGQPLTTQPRSIPSHVTYVTWLFYGIVIGCAYGSSLSALITSPDLSPVAESIPELVRGDIPYEYGASSAFRSGLGEEVFKHSDNPDIHEIYKNLQTDKSLTECLRKAASSNYACFHWDVMAQFAMDTEFVAQNGNKYPFLYSKDNVMFLPRTWSVRKREVFRAGFNFISGQSFDTGLWQEIMSRDERAVRRGMLLNVQKGKRKPLLGTILIKTALGEGNGPKPFQFKQVKACFVLLASGVALSALAFFGERLWSTGNSLVLKIGTIYNVRFKRERSNNAVVEMEVSGEKKYPTLFWPVG